MKPRESVLSIYPEAKCKRIDSGLFRVYALEKCIGFGGLPHVAWKNALDSCLKMQLKTANVIASYDKAAPPA